MGVIVNTKQLCAFLFLFFSCIQLAAYNQYGDLPLMREHQLFIREIQREMGLGHMTIHLRRMDDNSKKSIGGGFVTSYNNETYLYIDQEEFNTLAIPEKRFVVGHELAHILCGHHLYLYQDAKDYSLWLKLEEIKSLKRNNDLITAQAKVDQLCGTLNRHKILQFAKKMRDHEFIADEIAVKKLKCAKGAMAWCARDGINSQEVCDPFLDSHPTLYDRHSRFLYLQNVYGC